MARNRQRAKERQARRKAQGNGPAPARGAGDANAKRSEPAEPGVPEPEAVKPAAPEPEAVEPAAPEPEPPPPELTGSEALRTGAPPEDVGSPDSTLEYEQDRDAEVGEHFDPAQDHPEDEHGRPSAEAGRTQGRTPARFMQFLRAVVAELRRVQWPDRQALTTLTGVVLGFVLIAGGYLGLLDAIFSRVIQAIL